MKKVLVLGSGFVAGPMVRYLLSLGNVTVTVASAELERAEELTAGSPRGTARFLDVRTTENLRTLVNEHDLVVSLLPYTFHVMVAEQCIDLKKHLVTTSYVSPEMRELDTPAKKSGILLLNEIGLDPGIDHMSAMKIFDRIRNEQGTIISFESYCGGLPAPEAADNPFRYKFSWSPKGVLKAGKNNARFLRNGQLVEIPGSELFDNHWPISISGFEGKLEGYPNRDSISYIDLYQLHGVKTMLRGTLRYAGWSRVLKKIADLGLLDEEPSPQLKGRNYNSFMGSILGESTGRTTREETASRLNLPQNSSELDTLEWLGLFSEEPIPDDAAVSRIDVLTNLMERKMAYGPKERDMVILHHSFVADYPDHKKSITSTMIDYGIPGGDSSMARTVSLPAAIAVEMILKDEIALTGTHIPVLPEIYNPVLNKLESMNVKFEDNILIEPKTESR